MAAEDSKASGDRATDEIAVLVVAPNLGSDLSWLASMDPRIKVLDGNTDQRRDELLAQADVLLVGFPIPDRLAARAPRLKWAHHTQAGVSNLHESDLWSASVLLTSSRGYVAPTGIAEYVLAAGFFFARGLDEAIRQKRSGEFERAGYDLQTLAGSTIGVIGLGGIGGEVARLARALGMRVLAVRRSATAPKQSVDGVDLVLPRDQLSELARQSDLVAVCAQLTADTQGMIGARVFDAMKPNAILVNVARGELIDEPALVRALQQGQLRAAVLDVYDGELAGRPPRPQLLELPQVVLTPHISASGDRSVTERAKQLFSENLRRFLDERPLLNVVDRERGY